MNEHTFASRCEACEQTDAQCVDSCDDVNSPYFLCFSCQHRLHKKSLRPREWYNLAKRHSCERFLLHDDFYDENGVATQPEEDVEAAHRFPAPTLESVIGNIEQLLDYSITQWSLRPENKAAWAAHPKPDILKALFERYESTITIEVRSRILEICASTLSHYGTPLVKYAWCDYPATVSLAPLAEASAACLQLQDGLSRVTNAISELTGNTKYRSVGCLSYFQATIVLDWIEKNIFDPITESWGYVAAVSRLDWSRVEHWLQIGRPLSLVALDGLATIAQPHTPKLRELAPRLQDPPIREAFIQSLTQYRERDPVPRVINRVDFLISHASNLVNG